MLPFQNALEWKTTRCFHLHFWVASWQISPNIPQRKSGSCSTSLIITKSIMFRKFTRTPKRQFSWWWTMSLFSFRGSMVSYFPVVRVIEMWRLFSKRIRRCIFLYFLVLTKFEMWYLLFKCIGSCTTSLLNKLKSGNVISGELEGKKLSNLQIMQRTLHYFPFFLQSKM